MDKTKKAPYELNILLDTNIYYNEFKTDTQQMQALIHFLMISKSKLLIPSVVSAEVGKKFRDSINKAMLKIDSFPMLLKDCIKVNKSKEELVNEFESKWNNRIKYNASIITFGYEKVDVESLLNRSIAERPPFATHSRGFRDALIWESTIEYLKESDSKSPLCIITNDSGDFGKKELHTELNEELKAIGVESKFYNDLGNFLTDHNSQLDFLNKDTVTDWVESIEDLVKLNAMEEDIDPSYIEDDIDLDTDEVLDYVKPIEYESFQVYNYYVYKEDNKYFYVEVEVDVFSLLEITVSKMADFTYEYIGRDLITETRSVGHTHSHQYEFKVDKSDHTYSIFVE